MSSSQTSQHIQVPPRLFQVTSAEIAHWRKKVRSRDCKQPSCEGCYLCQSTIGSWSFLHHFERNVADIQRQAEQGTLQLGPCRSAISLKDDRPTLYWESARDQWICHRLGRSLSQILGSHMTPSYYSAPGRGRHQAVLEVTKKIETHPFTFKTDVKSYYQTIQQNVLYKKLKLALSSHPQRELLLRLISQVLTPLVEHADGRLDYYREGIPKGFSTSPFFAWFYLAELDSAFASPSPGVFYQRYVDDIVLMASTRSKLNNAKKMLNKSLHRNRLKNRPDITFNGRSN